MQDNLLYSKICSLCHVKRMVFANSQEIEIVEWSTVSFQFNPITLCTYITCVQKRSRRETGSNQENVFWNLKVVGFYCIVKNAMQFFFLIPAFWLLSLYYNNMTV